MNKKEELQYMRTIEVITNRPNKIWRLEELLEAVNRLLHDSIIIESTYKLINLIRRRRVLKIFYCLYHAKRYYIFKKCIPLEDGGYTRGQ